MDYESMTIEELDAYLIDLGVKKDAIRADMRAAKAVMEKKIILRDAGLESTKTQLELIEAAERNQ